MKIIAGKEKEYQTWFDKNDDPYSRRCFTFAQDWADLMEAAMAGGARLEDIALSTSHAADTDGITGFMYGMAVAILSKAWIHGERLRRWHNLDRQIHNEGKRANEKGTVLNPALLCIGEGEEDTDERP